jgi:outer membrane cobalamin receptor
LSIKPLFTIKTESPNNFSLLITKPSYDSLFVTNISNAAVDTFEMNSNNILNEVIVKSKKAVITYDADKMIFNPENMPGLESIKVFDLLSNIPGIFVDNETIKLNGNASIQILIDDRKRSFTIDQAVKLLKSIPANQIKNIEIIHGNSVRYDASGSGGVINIVTKKNVADGIFTSIKKTSR